MKNQRLTQIAISLYVVLSLFASSLAACACNNSNAPENHCQNISHSHETKADNQSHHAENQTASTNHESNCEHRHNTISTDNFSVNSTSDDCCCVQNAPKTFVKSEIVKIEKQAISYQSNAPPPTELTAPSKSIEAIYFAKPLYLSDSFYNLKSPRAPPRS